MGLIADGDVEVRGLVDLHRDLLGTDYDHHVTVLRDLRQGLVHALAVHGEMDDRAVESLGGLLPGHAGPDGVVTAEPFDDAADVLLQHWVLGIHVDPAGPQGSGGQCHMRGHALVPFRPVPYPHYKDAGHPDDLARL